MRQMNIYYRSTRKVVDANSTPMVDSSWRARAGSTIVRARTLVRAPRERAIPRTSMLTIII